jgi:hypothetical protein
MPSTNDQWRSLLRPANQMLIMHVLKIQFADIYLAGKAANIISPTHEEQRALHDTPDDLVQICKLYFTTRFSNPTGEQRFGVDSIGYHLIQNPSYREAIDLTSAQAQLFRRRTIDIPVIARVIRDHRNYQAHDNAEIDDEGNAALLASSVLRLLEIVKIPEDRESECGLLRDEAFRILHSISENDQTESQDDSAQSKFDEVISEVSNLRKALSNQTENESSAEKLDVAMQSKFSGTIRKEHLNTEHLAKELGRQLERVEQKQDIIFPMIEQMLQSLRQGEKNEADLANKLADELRGIAFGQENLIARLDKKVEIALQTIPAATKDAIADFAKQLPSIEDPEDNWVEDETIDFDENDSTQPVPTLVSSTGSGTTITREQGRQRLLSLRNDIRRRFQIENWENILQGPIIDAMLRGQVTDLEEWKVADDISWRFLKHSGLMTQQLEEHWGQISDILENIEWEGPAWGDLDDEIPF